jgi:hypothetical protein
MPAHFINDPDHWRERADAMRTLAAGVKDEQSKQTMLRITSETEPGEGRVWLSSASIPRAVCSSPTARI